MGMGTRPRIMDTPSYRSRPVDDEARGEQVSETQTQQTTAAAPIALSPEQFAQLLAAAKGNAASAGGFSADELAKAIAQQNQRENVNAPMVSVYNPKGETAHPRPQFTAKKVYQNGVELNRDTLTWEEIEALNALSAVPGEYRVEKADGTPVPFTIKLTRGFNENTVERVDIHFPSKDEHREGHRPLIEYAYEVLEKVGRSDDVTRIRGLKKELDALRRV